MLTRSTSLSIPLPRDTGSGSPAVRAKEPPNVDGAADPVGLPRFVEPDFTRYLALRSACTRIRAAGLSSCRRLPLPDGGPRATQPPEGGPPLSAS